MTFEKAVEKYKSIENPSKNLHLKHRREVYYLSKDLKLFDDKNREVKLSEKDLTSKSWIVVDY